MTHPAQPRYRVAQLDELPPIDCPCGEARRAFALPDNAAATVHLVEIRADAQTHYHREHTEIYVVLAGEGAIELDGDLIPVRPLSAVLIRPGCRHRAIGRLRILNLVVPAFDPADEWHDSAGPRPSQPRHAKEDVE